MKRVGAAAEPGRALDSSRAARSPAAAAVSAAPLRTIPVPADEGDAEGDADEADIDAALCCCGAAAAAEDARVKPLSADASAVAGRITAGPFPGRPPPLS